MKVESINDVQPLQRVDPPRVSPEKTAAVATGFDEVAQVFNQEVALNNQALNRRSTLYRYSCQGTAGGISEISDPVLQLTRPLEL